MKNLFLLLALVGAFWACGDDECTQADWVGTYELSTSECSDSTVSFSDDLIISEGADGAISIDGESVEFNDCSTTLTSIFGNVTLNLNGDKIEAEGLGCTGEYTRN